MNKKKREMLISIVLIVIAIVFTILVKVVDVKPVGAGGTEIGFSTINKAVSNTIGVHMEWYKITAVLGFIPIVIALAYMLIGFMQLLKRKSISKVDKEIIGLGVYYVAIAIIYIFFEKVIINYRPVLMDGALEASYPSSHTFITICLCGGLILVNRKLFDNKLTRLLNFILLIVGIIIVVGRIISGVHWCTDILGGIIISSAVVMSFYTLNNLRKE